MKFFKKTKVNSDIPTSSMADIAFLLIIFFMVTTVFSATKGLEFKLPKDDQKDLPPDTEEAVYIKVLPNSSVTVDGKPMELDGILDYLEPKLTRDAEKAVILYTSAEAPYRAMVAVYDVLSQAETTRGFKVKNISIPTQSEIEDYIRLFGYNPFEVEGGV